MATKQSKKTTPKAAKATGSKSKTAHAKSAEAEGTKSKAKTSKSTSAQAADGKTKAKAKSTTKSAAAKRKPAHASASDSKTEFDQGEEDAGPELARQAELIASRRLTNPMDARRVPTGVPAAWPSDRPAQRAA